MTKEMLDDKCSCYLVPTLASLGIMASNRDVGEFTGAVMALVEVIRRGQSRAFNTEQVAVMQLLAGSDALLPSEIAAALDVPRSSITRRIQELQRADKVEIEPSASDGRSYRVRLTQAGRAELDALAAKGRDLFATWVSDWSDEEIQTFTALARRLTDQPRDARALQRQGAWWKAPGR
jgi:DNA-binding MarR family transcriptional regulator